MQLPLQISFRDIDRSDAVEAAIREKVAKLDRFSEHVMACRVMVGLISKHKHQGKLFNVRVDLTAPGDEIVVKRDRSEIARGRESMNRRLGCRDNDRRGDITWRQ